MDRLLKDIEASDRRGNKKTRPEARFFCFYVLKASVVQKLNLPYLQVIYVLATVTMSLQPSAYSAKLVQPAMQGPRTVSEQAESQP